MRNHVLPVLGSGMLLLGSVALAVPVGAQATPDVEFTFTGAPEEWVVPADVCSITVAAFGAQGGGPLDDVGDDALDDTAPRAQVLDDAALGGSATATLTVTPGSTLTVRVGGAGQDGDDGGDWGAGGAGGFNGGGAGGTGDPTTDDNVSGGGGGGGATDISLGGTRLLVAGGGGGAAGFSEAGSAEGAGGHGGGEVGVDGQPGSDEENLPGGGGTQTEGGAGGVGSDGAPNGEPGTSGQGGAGGAGTAYNGGGGGGGGGWFGGGGGGGVISGEGSAAGGGGGSGFGPAGTTFETGVRAGDGLLTITLGDEPCPSTTTGGPATTAAAAAAGPRPIAAPGATPVAAQPRFTG